MALLLILMYAFNKVVWLSVISQNTYITRKQYRIVLLFLFLATVISLANITSYFTVFLCHLSINVLLAIFIFYNSRNYYIAILLSFTQYILIMSIRIPISYLFYFTLDSPLFLLLVLLLENVIYYWFCVYLKKRKYQTILQNILSYPIKNKRSAAVFLSLFTIAFIGIQFFYLDIFTLAYIVSYVFFLLSTSIWLLITYIYTQKNMQKKILELKESRNRAAEDSLDNALNLQHDLKNMLFPLESYLKKNKNQEAISYLKSISEYTADELSGSFIKYIENIEITSIRELFMVKLLAIQSEQIPFHLFVSEHISEVRMNHLDFLRCVGILIDNAIEYSKGIDTAEINIFFIKKMDMLEFRVENLLEKGIQLDIKTMLTRGYTTKTNHKGRGLSIIQNIQKRYPFVSFTVLIDQSYFKANLHIRQEDNVRIK